MNLKGAHKDDAHDTSIYQPTRGVRLDRPERFNGTMTNYEAPLDADTANRELMSCYFMGIGPCVKGGTKSGSYSPYLRRRRR